MQIMKEHKAFSAIESDAFLGTVWVLYDIKITQKALDVIKSKIAKSLDLWALSGVFATIQIRSARVQVPFAAPNLTSQTVGNQGFAKFFFCPKGALGFIWDLFLSRGKSHEKVDLYDASFSDLELSLHLVAVILPLLL